MTLKSKGWWMRAIIWKNDNQSFLKTAQRWFRGQRIRTINPFLSSVWRVPPWGACQQRDHWHWSSRSAICSQAHIWAWHRHAHWMWNDATSPPSPPVSIHRAVTFSFCVYVPGDDIEHEHDTVLQLQEVIEQLRNVFPSEPGEFVSAVQLFGSVVPPALCCSITHRGGQQICTAAGR